MEPKVLEAIINISDGIRASLDGDGILFLGTGLSFLYKNENGERVPDVDGLKALLLKKEPPSGSTHPLDRLSSAIVKKDGADFVYGVLTKNLKVTSVDPRLVDILRAPWRRIYTTNYDDAVEVARKGLPASGLTLQNDVSEVAPGSVVHINGSIKKLTPHSLDTDVVLTDTSYGTNQFADSEWFRFFLRDMKAARVVIFAGYSLADLDIARALISDETLARKIKFFISPQADEIEISSMGSYGEVVAGGFDRLTELFSEVSEDYSPVPRSNAFLALREVNAEAVNGVNSESAASTLRDELVYGKLPESKILLDEEVFPGHQYLVHRAQNAEIEKAIRSGRYRDVLILGELASGKTAAALLTAKYLLDNDYRVFYAQKSDSLVDELLKLSKNTGLCAVIFEHYSIFEKEIAAYAAARPGTHRIILTERAVTHELLPGMIDRIAGLGPLIESYLGKIDLESVPKFESLVNFGGFWGDRAGASEAARRNHIISGLDSSLYRLLVEIVKSKSVQDEVKALLAPLTNDRRALKLFVSSFIVNVLGSSFSINDWQAVFEAQWVRRVMRTYSEQVRHFLSLNSDAIFPRAGVLSAEILRTFTDNDLVRECMVDLYERTARADHSDGEMWSLRVALTRYGSIEPLFSDEKKGENIARYYDDIRVYGDTRNNADYWLQVGIAATIHEDLDRAGDAFKIAYSREKARRFPKLMRIDNYYSRYQMRRAVDLTDHDAAFREFLEASARLKKQMFLDENRHYPYKTGRYYSEIATRHFNDWTLDQREKFILEAKAIRERANEWQETKKEFSTDVAILLREITTMLGKLTEE